MQYQAKVHVNTASDRPGTVSRGVACIQSTCGHATMPCRMHFCILFFPSPVFRCPTDHYTFNHSIAVPYACRDFLLDTSNL